MIVDKKIAKLVCELEYRIGLGNLVVDTDILSIIVKIKKILKIVN